jgi:hypothetical protein
MFEVDWELDCRRNLIQEDYEELLELQEALEVIQISEEDDGLIWALEPSGKFSSKSLYRLMVHPGEVDRRMVDLWEIKLPLKIKVFLWMLWHDRVQIGEQLTRRKSKHSEFCKYCGHVETRDHLFFNCNITQMIWVWVRVSLRWYRRPTSMTSFQDMLNAGEVENSKSANFFVLASVAWSVWKTRNDWVFNNRLIKSPKALAYQVLALLQQWKKILKMKDQEVMEDTLMKLQEGLRMW